MSASNKGQPDFAPASTTVASSLLTLGGAERGLGAEAPCWLGCAFAENCQHEAEAPQTSFRGFAPSRDYRAELRGRGGTAWSRRGLSEAAYNRATTHPTNKRGRPR